MPTAQVPDAIGSLTTAIVDIEGAPDTAFPSSVDIAAFKQTIGRDLLDYCIVEYLLGQRFKLGRLSRLIGIVQLIDAPANGLRQAYQQRYVNWAEAGTLLTETLTGFRNVYDWRTATPQCSGRRHAGRRACSRRGNAWTTAFRQSRTCGASSRTNHASVRTSWGLGSGNPCHEMAATGTKWLAK